MKRQIKDWQKIFEIYILDEGFLCRIHKKLFNSIIMVNPIKWAKVFTGSTPKKIWEQSTNTCSALLVTRVCKLKTQENASYSTYRGKIRLTALSVGRDEEQLNAHTLLVGRENGAATLENRLAVSFKVKNTLTYGPAIPYENICSQKDLYVNVHYSFIDNGLNWE